MKHEPIDYNNPLGISKREWTRVLGVNLALLLLVYGIATILTLCGNDFFMLKVENAYLQNMENILRGWGIYPLVQLGLATIEETIILWFVLLKKPRWWWPVSYYAIRLANNLIFMAVGVTMVPGWSVFLINIVFVGVFIASKGKNCLKPLIRFGISMSLSLGLNGLITLFRTKITELGHVYTNIQVFYLSIEYDLALLLALGLLAIVIPWNKKKGDQPCPTIGVVGGSSQTLTKKSPKNLPTKNNGLTDRQLRKIRMLKMRMVVIQTIALIFIALFPLLIGKIAEFVLMYVSFCLTRLILGFSRSLHFKSELSCVTIGALTFWGLTFLSPNVEVSIILSLVYGCALALGFRLYWELHDLIMYNRMAKTDRFAMFYVVFRGNLSERHVRGVMRAKGYVEVEDIKMVQMYVQRDKVDYIAENLGFAKITIEKRLTEIATDLYAKR